MSNEEIRNLFLAADEDENHYAAAYIKFLLLTGVRKSEGLAAKWEDIQVSSGRRVWHIPHTKSGKSRHVILNPMAIDILEALPRVKGNPYLFPGKVEGNLIQNPMKAFKRIIKRAGIEETFRLHDIRHTVASLIINTGAPCYLTKFRDSCHLYSFAYAANGGCPERPASPPRLRTKPLRQGYLKWLDGYS